MSRLHPPCKSYKLPATLFNQLGNGLYCDLAGRTAVFTDINSAVDFRRHFPFWEVRCLIILPRRKLEAGGPRNNSQSQITPAVHHPPTPQNTSHSAWGTISLLHPLLTVPATADILGLWMGNGRFIGLEVRFPDGHHTHLTFQEIQELQHDHH